MDFENTDVHIISEIEPYYFLVLYSQNSGTRKIAITTNQDNVY